MPLQILSLALIVCLFGWLYNSCALLPCGREKELFWITLVSGLLNVGLNILLIPRFRENADEIGQSQCLDPGTDKNDARTAAEHRANGAPVSRDRDQAPGAADTEHHGAQLCRCV